MPIRDRLDTMSRGELAGLALVVVVTLAGAALWYTRSLPRPVQIAAPSPAAAGGSASPGAGSSASPSAAAVIVDVAGWVRSPGVYQFAPGDRVIDAVTRAGGARKGADLSAINLAAPLSDGTQILIPRGLGKGGSAAGTGGSGPGGTPLVNINIADQQRLESLSGVGPVLAAAIVQYRTQHGPFRSVDDLLDVSGIGPATLEEIRPQVTL